jgi:hypothetical protein
VWRFCHAALPLQAERQAVNSVCQGSAADIVKGAMLQLVQQLEQQGLAGNARLLLQVGGFPAAPWLNASCAALPHCTYMRYLAQQDLQ